MNIASYFATLGIKITKGEIKKVDDFLGKLEKGLEKVVEEATDAEKATKKSKKATDESTKALKEKLTWQDKLNKFMNNELKLTFAIAQNQKALAKNFRQSVDAMVIKPATAKKLKEQQALYNGLFGATSPRAMVGAKGNNQAAWSRQFNQRIQQLTQQSKVSRASRQADLEAVFGIPKARSNPRVAALLNDRLGYLNGSKNGTLTDMAAMYRQDEKISKDRENELRRRAENEEKIAKLKDKEHKREESRQKDEERWYQREKQRQRDRMEVIAARSRIASEANASRLSAARIRANSTRGSRGGANLIHAGGAVGAVARYGLAAIPFVGGALGLSALNSRNQEIQSAEFGAKAIMGNEAGTKNMEWLKQQANRIGFNWLDAAPEFTGFMGSASPLMGESTALSTFQAFNEFSTTRHAPALARQRALMALKQMASKGKIMSEELHGQLGEAQGFGELPMMFAEAYQDVIGGNLKGDKAANALKEAMKEGKVRSADLLPLVTKRMSDAAAPTLAQSAKSSQAEQARWQNAYNQQVMNANKAGVESGYARIFKALTVTMEESTPLVESMAKWFDKASIHVAEIVLDMQSIGRFFEGRDSWFGDTFFGTEDRRNAAFEWLGSVRTLMKEMGGLLDTIYKGWSQIFQLLTSSTVVQAITSMQTSLANLIGAINSAANGDYAKAGAQLKAAFVESDNGVVPYNPAGHEASLEAAKAKAAADRRIAGYPGTVGILPMSQEEQATKAMLGTGQYSRTLQSNVTVDKVEIVITTADSDSGDALAAKLQPHIEKMFTVAHDKAINQALLMVPTPAR